MLLYLNIFIKGLQIKEAEYLQKFGPGHFDFTFMLGEKGFNEMELNLLKHLLKNNKPVVFVRTKCDADLNLLIHQDSDSEDLDNFHDPKILKERGMQSIKKDLENFINNKVLINEDIQMNKLGIL